MSKLFKASIVALVFGIAIGMAGYGHAETAESTKQPSICQHSYQLQEDSHEATDTESGLRHYRCTVCAEEYSYETAPLVYTVNPKTGAPVNQAGAYNPLLPVWEHIPDGEPKVFWSKEDNEWRVYVYGSHDDVGKTFCGLNYRLWSAPVYDLSDWRFDGVILDISEENTYGGFSLFAPDCAYDVTTDTYYMIANQMQSKSVLRKGPTPAGPFAEDEGIWTMQTKACYDPAIYIENGTIYIAGSCMKQIYNTYPEIEQAVAEDGYQSGMSHIGVIYQLKKDLSDGDGVEAISWMPNDERSFLPIYEGPSLVGWVEELGAYVYLYVANDVGGDGTNYCSTLAYLWTDDLMNGTWHYGRNNVEEIYPELQATVSGNHGNTVADVTGRYTLDAATGEMTFRDFPTYTHANDHGGMAKINGKWYIFGHRHTNLHSSSRQTIAQEIAVCTDAGVPMISVAEYTSSGAAGSIPAFEEIPAYRTCYLLESPDHQAYSTDSYNPHTDCAETSPYVTATREEGAEHMTYVTNLRSGSVVGFKYLDFGSSASGLEARVLVSQTEAALGTIHVYLDAPSEEQGGTQIGSISVSADEIAAAEKAETGSDGRQWAWLKGAMDAEVGGVHPVFFVVETDASILCDFDAFSFGNA